MENCPINLAQWIEIEFEIEIELLLQFFCIRNMGQKINRFPPKNTNGCKSSNLVYLVLFFHIAEIKFTLGLLLRL